MNIATNCTVNIARKQQILALRALVVALALAVAVPVALAGEPIPGVDENLGNKPLHPHATTVSKTPAAPAKPTTLRPTQIANGNYSTGASTTITQSKTPARNEDANSAMQDVSTTRMAGAPAPTSGPANGAIHKAFHKKRSLAQPGGTSSPQGISDEANSGTLTSYMHTAANPEGPAVKNADTNSAMQDVSTTRMAGAPATTPTQATDAKGLTRTAHVNVIRGGHELATDVRPTAPRPGHPPPLRPSISGQKAGAPAATPDATSSSSPPIH